MRLLLAPLGILIVVATLADLFRTSLGPPGGGPLSARLARLAWHRLRRLNDGRFRHRRLAWAGPVVVMAVAGAWLTLLWAGWTILFSADPVSVAESRTARPVGLWSRADFVGHTLVTLGLGDYRPNGVGWRLATLLVAGSGVVTIILIIVYWVAVLGAVARKRHLAAHIACLGHTPQDILVHAWDGQGFPALAPHLVILTGLIAEQSRHYRRYPVLRYFHADTPDTSLALRLAALDEAVRLLERLVDPACRPPPAALRPLREAIGQFLDIVSLGSPAEDPPPPAPLPPVIDPLLAAGIATVDRGGFRTAVAEDADRRRRLAAFVRDSGWHWDQVNAGPPVPD